MLLEQVTPPRFEAHVDAVQVQHSDQTASKLHAAVRRLAEVAREVKEARRRRLVALSSRRDHRVWQQREGQPAAQPHRWFLRKGATCLHAHPLAMLRLGKTR